MTIAKEQMGVIFKTNNAPLEYKRIPVPEVGHDEVLINIRYSGVCHTDLHAWKGKYASNSIQLTVGDWPLNTKPNLVGGHEGAGDVVAVGSDVKDVQIGDHVGIKVP